MPGRSESPVAYTTTSMPRAVSALANSPTTNSVPPYPLGGTDTKGVDTSAARRVIPPPSKNRTLEECASRHRQAGQPHACPPSSRPLAGKEPEVQSIVGVPDVPGPTALGCPDRGRASVGPVRQLVPGKLMQGGAWSVDPSGSAERELVWLFVERRGRPVCWSRGKSHSTASVSSMSPVCSVSDVPGLHHPGSDPAICPQSNGTA